MGKDSQYITNQGTWLYELNMVLTKLAGSDVMQTIFQKLHLLLKKIKDMLHVPGDTKLGGGGGERRDGTLSKHVDTDATYL